MVKRKAGRAEGNIHHEGEPAHCTTRAWPYQPDTYGGQCVAAPRQHRRMPNCVAFMRETFEESLAGVKVGIVRKQTSRRSQAAAKLLFEGQPDYRFSIYVTNLDLPPYQIWNIYNIRADCEPSVAR